MKCTLIFLLVVLGALSQYSDFDDSVVDSISQYVADQPQAECSIRLQELLNSSLAIPFLDAIGKHVSGATVGDFSWFGNYQLCTDLMKITDLRLCDTIGPIKFQQGEDQNRTVPDMLLWTTCLPLECKEQFVDIMSDTITIYGQTLAQLNNNSNTGQKLKTVCTEDHEYDAGAYVAITICSIFLLMNTIGTLWGSVEYYIKAIKDEFNCRTGDAGDNEDNKEENVELEEHKEDLEEKQMAENANQAKESEHERKRESIIATIFKCFALGKNISTLMDTSTKPGQVLCMNGIRVITMAWIVCAHMYIIPLIITLRNSYDVYKIVNRRSMAFAMNPFLSVESFFVMSGFLVSYLMLKNFKNGRRFGNIAIGYYIHRYIRLTVPYAIVILVQGFIYPQYIDGPFADNLITGHEHCKNWWWTNLLYINNFVPWSLPAQCISQAWYLANDMQFFIAAPLFIHFLWNKPIIGNILCWGCVGMASVANGIGTYVYEWNSTPFKESVYLLYSVDERETLGGDLYNYSYTKPYIRIVTYLVGVYGGWFYFRYKETLVGLVPVSKIKKLLLSICLWVVTLTIEYEIVFGLHSDEYSNPLYNEPQSKTVPYATLARLGWALALVTQILLCELGMGGPINAFLSWRGWLPLARLTFGIYLLHFGINIILVSRMRHVFSLLPDIQPIVVFLGLFFVTHMASVLLFLVVEQPVANLEKKFMTPQSKRH